MKTDVTERPRKSKTELSSADLERPMERGRDDKSDVGIKLEGHFAISRHIRATQMVTCTWVSVPLLVGMFRRRICSRRREARPLCQTVDRVIVPLPKRKSIGGQVDGQRGALGEAALGFRRRECQRWENWNGAVDCLDDLITSRTGIACRLASHCAVNYGHITCTTPMRQASFSSILRGMSLVLTLPPAALIASSQGGAHQANHNPTHAYPIALHTSPGARVRTRVDEEAHRAARIAISSIRIPAGCKRKNWNVGPLFPRLRWIAKSPPVCDRADRKNAVVVWMIVNATVPLSRFRMSWAR